MKNRLNYTYRKTSVKNTKIISDYSLIMANIFLKIIVRAINLNYEFVFIDETKIQQINSNFYCWKKKGEYIFNDIKNKQQRNLIMAVSPKGLIFIK